MNMISPALAGSEAAPSGEGAAVIRHIGDPQSPLLTGVTIAGGSTLVFLSGQVPPIVDATASPDSIEAYGDTKTQTIGIFEKTAALLAAQGLGLGDVVKLTVFLVGDPKLDGRLDYWGFAEGYDQFFGTKAQPNKVARSTVQVAALAIPGFLVEIEAIAVKA